MNWKEQPSLFHGFEVETERKQRLPIVGATLDKKSLILQMSIVQFHCAIDNCQLIARPIEDMTDEEWSKLHFDYMYLEDQVHSIEYDIENNALSSKKFLHLLSIGVYPFSDTEDVVFTEKQEA